LHRSAGLQRPPAAPPGERREGPVETAGADQGSDRAARQGRGVAKEEGRGRRQLTASPAGFLSVHLRSSNWIADGRRTSGGRFCVRPVTPTALQYVRQKTLDQSKLRRVEMSRTKTVRFVWALGAMLATAVLSGPASAQTVTTGT